MLHLQPVFTLPQVYKETSKRALDEQFGGEDETPPPAPGFTSPTLKLTKYSNAYMLVYIRESSWKDIMRDVPEEDIAEHVRSRLKVPYLPPTQCCACLVMSKHGRCAAVSHAHLLMPAAPWACVVQAYHAGLSILHHRVTVGMGVKETLHLFSTIGYACIDIEQQSVRPLS